MARQLNQGTVKSFSRRNRWGFLHLENGEELWFHFGAGRYPLIKDGQSDYGKPTTPWIGGKVLPLPFPEKGDLILFERGVGKKGPKAVRWTFQYLLVEAWIRYEDDQAKCPYCPHKNGVHRGGVCMEDCTCGDEILEIMPEEEPREINVGGHPSGFKIYE